ncbi:MAG: flagellar biosynthesis anti-sigma factor FlgM [Gallionella sp.]|nr:flagellar biosynthesis anti-sigma factor FlgM [Gallionella sp.]
MKIDKNSKPLPPTLNDGARTAKNKAGGQTAPTRQDSTSVSLGSTASQLNSMENSMASVPVADAAKVAEIKQAISDGRFKVNSEVVADRLIQTVRDLIANPA